MSITKLFKSAGHFLAALTDEIQTVINWLGKAEAKISQVGIALEANKGKLLGDALAIVKAASDAERAKGLNLPLDAAFVESLRQALHDIENLKPGSTTPPAGLPLTAPMDAQVVKPAA